LQAAGFGRQAPNRRLSALKVSTKTLTSYCTFAHYSPIFLLRKHEALRSSGGSLLTLRLKAFPSKLEEAVRNVCGKCSTENVEHAKAIVAPQKSEFRMGFPEEVLTIHKQDARSIAIALVQISPSGTQANNLSGND